MANKSARTRDPRAAEPWFINRRKKNHAAKQAAKLARRKNR